MILITGSTIVSDKIKKKTLKMKRDVGIADQQKEGKQGRDDSTQPTLYIGKFSLLKNFRGCQ